MHHDRSESRQRTICHGILAGWTLIWAFLIRQSALYNGYDGNDLCEHKGYILAAAEGLKHGSLGLDNWFLHFGFGMPIFRIYQGFAHYLVAFLYVIFPSVGISRLVHLLIATSLLALPGLYYYSGRRLGLSRLTSLFAGLLSLFIATDRTDFGVSFESYLFVGFGLFTQAVSVPFTLLSLTSGLELLGWSGRDVSKRRIRLAIEVGFWIALTCLTHFFYGYFVTLSLAILGAIGLLKKWHRPEQIAREAAIVAVIVAIGMAYILLSIFQDYPLLARFESTAPLQWHGTPIRELFRLGFLRGELMDHNRMPVLTGLFVAGLFASLRPKAPRAERGWLLVALIGLFLLSGWSVFGKAMYWIPGVKQVHLSRSIGLVHIAGIFIIGSACEFIWSASARISRQWLAPLSAALILAALCYLSLDRAHLLAFNAQAIQGQEFANDSLVGKKIFAKTRQELEYGNLVTPFPNFVARVGYIPIEAFAMERGYSQLTNPRHLPYYPSHLMELFDFDREDHYRIYNAGLFITSPRALKPFMRPLRLRPHLDWISIPSGQHFLDVVSVEDVKIVSSEEAYMGEMKKWLNGPPTPGDRYISVIPSSVRNRWPGSVPSVGAGPVEGAVVASPERNSGPLNGKILVKKGPAYGVLKLVYHPRWHVTVNDKSVTPLWMGPGFLGFPLQQGENRISIDFPADPVREALFLISFLLLTSIAAYLYILPLMSRIEWKGRLRIKVPTGQLPEAG